jgi:lysophospholipase L1-like esterase
MKKVRLVFLLGLSLGMTATFATAQPATETKPEKSQTAAKAPAQKDEPTVPSVKGTTDKQKEAFLKRHENFLKDKEELLKKGPIQFVALGDSITDGWRTRGKEVWAKTFGEWNAYNTGIGGDRTQHVLWRIDNGELDGIEPNPKVAMLMIGTNNLGPNPSDEEIADGVKACVEDIHKHLPKTKVLLLGIFPRDNDKKSEVGSPTEPVRARIKHINEIISKLDDGGKTVKYLDIGDKFLDKDGGLHKEIMPDYLHPNEKGYEIWAEAVKPVIEEMMK